MRFGPQLLESYKQKYLGKYIYRSIYIYLYHVHHSCVFSGKLVSTVTNVTVRNSTLVRKYTLRNLVYASTQYIPAPQHCSHEVCYTSQHEVVAMAGYLAYTRSNLLINAWELVKSSSNCFEQNTISLFKLSLAAALQLPRILQAKSRVLEGMYQQYIKAPWNARMQQIIELDLLAWSGRRSRTA